MIPALNALRKLSLGKGLARLASLLVLGGALAGCQSGMGGGASVGQSVKVALLVPYGSANAGDDLVARSLENAARLAMAESAGITIDLVVYPTAADPAQAASAAQTAIAQGADVILGPLRSDEAAAVGVAAAPQSRAVLSFSNNTAIAGRNVFVLGHTFENTARRILGYSAANGRNRVVILHARNLAGEVARDAVRGAAGQTGASIVGELAYEFSQTGVLAAVPEVQSLIQQSAANALILTSDASGALPLFGQLLADSGTDTTATQLIGLTRWDTPPQTLEIRGLQGGWFALPDPEAEAAFRTRYQLTYGEVPHILAGLSYDGMRAIIDTVARTGRIGAADFTTGSGFAGANGVFRLLNDGTNERAMAVVMLQNRQIIVVDPAPRLLGAGF